MIIELQHRCILNLEKEWPGEVPRRTQVRYLENEQSEYKRGEEEKTEKRKELDRSQDCNGCFSVWMQAENEWDMKVTVGV